MRDLRSYCSILLDNTNRKPIWRLHFNDTEHKYLGLFDKGREEDRVQITKLDEIFTYAERLKATVKRYESSGSQSKGGMPTGTQTT